MWSIRLRLFVLPLLALAELPCPGKTTVDDLWADRDFTGKSLGLLWGFVDFFWIAGTNTFFAFGFCLIFCVV